MPDNDNAKDRDTQWHSGSYSAMLLRCRNYRDRIAILRELPLATKPLLLDVVIIKLDDGVEVTETSPGVYNVDAPPPMFKTTIAAYGSMPPEDAAWLSALTSHIKEPHALDLAHQMHTMWDDADEAMRAGCRRASSARSSGSCAMGSLASATPRSDRGSRSRHSRQ